MLFLLVTLSMQAQFVGRGVDPRLTSRQQRPVNDKLPEFNVLKAVGIVKYDYERVIKKSGVKKNSETAKKVKSIITKFNRDINGIKRINSFTMNSMKTTVENTQKKAISSGDFSKIPQVKKDMDAAFKPIIEAVQKKDEELDAALEKVLSKKQFKKWIKYKNKKKKK